MPLINLFSKRQIGDQKEQEAKRFLLKQNLEFLEQNFNSKYGEIDLIFYEKSTSTVVFVEVRYRNSNKYGGAAQSVTPAKQLKIKKTALFYISQRKITSNIRFDVIAFEGEQLNWLQSAFS